MISCPDRFKDAAILQMPAAGRGEIFPRVAEFTRRRADPTAALPIRSVAFDRLTLAFS